MGDEHCENADILKEHRKDSCIYCVKKSLNTELTASEKTVNKYAYSMDKAKSERDAAEAKLAISEGKVKALGDAMDKIHAKVMVEYPEVIYDIADKALALIDRPGSEIPK